MGCPVEKQVAADNIKQLSRGNETILVAEDEPALAGIVSELNDLLAALLKRSDIESDEFVSTVIYSLSKFADPRSRSLIETAFENDRVDKFLINEEDVESAYRNGGMPSKPSDDPRAWLSHYREYYQNRLENPDDDPDEDLTSYSDGDLDDEEFEDEPLPAPVETIRRTVQLPGRNDPCWCGSGKKYKKCHWSDDQNRIAPG